MLLHDFKLFARELAGVKQNAVRYANLADVMQKAGLLKIVDEAIVQLLAVYAVKGQNAGDHAAGLRKPLEMPARIAIPRFREMHQRTDRSPERVGNLMYLGLNQLFQMLAVLLELVLHPLALGDV
ncbi:hypothetical protein SDC9_110518 [bioreactor metagenome]|uniref:Uncharacterized protein n=1 Tax=bioreactor metagenome TaxID=1076179 RepID=A0A645BE73_9ZZZZ